MTYMAVLPSDWLKVMLGSSTIKSKFTKRIVLQSILKLFLCQFAPACVLFRISDLDFILFFMFSY